MADENTSGVAHQTGIVLPPEKDQRKSLAEEDWGLITRFMDPDANLSPTDIYAFRTIPTGDGLDFYWTRQGDSSLDNFTRSFSAGMSLLGNHAVDTFSYGQSYAAERMAADPEAPWYEGTFYSKHSAAKNLATSKVIAAKSYILRDVELNQQKTDDLIRAMQGGAARRVSISFTVGQYQCGIDGKDVMAGWQQGADAIDSKGCRHFPGVNYASGGIAYAWMHDNELLEQSLVYRNASPSAMLIRKAVEMATRGMFSPADMGRVEQRLELRLPARQKSQFQSVEVPMGSEARHPEPGTDPVIDPAPAPTPPVEAVPPVAAVAPETTAESTEAATEAADAAAAAEHAVEGATEGAPVAAGESRAVTGAPTILELRGTIAQFEARWAAQAEALGGVEPSATNLRSINQYAELGKTLAARKVDEAVRERTRAVGEGYTAQMAERYRQHLLNARTPEGALDIEYIEDETSLSRATKEGRIQPGRSVTPADLPPPSRDESRRAPAGPPPVGPADNVLA